MSVSTFPGRLSRLTVLFTVGLAGLSSLPTPVQATESAFVGVAGEFTGFSATFAERSTLFADTNLSVWQGGSVATNGVPSGRWDIPLASGVAPLVATSATGVRYSQPVAHNVYIGPDTTKVTFADRMGWLVDGGAQAGLKYPAFSTAPDRDNWISFVPAQPSFVGKGQAFQLGTFEVRNGSWHSENNGALGPVLVPFTLRTTSSNTSFANHVFNGTFAFQPHQVNGLADNSLANADEFWIVELPQLGSARVIEKEVGTFEIWGSINSLHIDSFRNAQGGVVLTSHVGAIPEPGTALLLACGTLFVVASAAKRRSHQHPRLRT